jgi:hypothetical protein
MTELKTITGLNDLRKELENNLREAANQDIYFKFKLDEAKEAKHFFRITGEVIYYCHQKFHPIIQPINDVIFQVLKRYPQYQLIDVGYHRDFMLEKTNEGVVGGDPIMTPEEILAQQHKTPSIQKKAAEQLDVEGSPQAPTATKRSAWTKLNFFWKKGPAVRKAEIEPKGPKIGSQRKP